MVRSNLVFALGNYTPCLDLWPQMMFDPHQKWYHVFNMGTHMRFIHVVLELSCSQCFVTLTFSDLKWPIPCTKYYRGHEVSVGCQHVKYENHTCVPSGNTILIILLIISMVIYAYQPNTSIACTCTFKSVALYSIINLILSTDDNVKWTWNNNQILAKL